MSNKLHIKFTEVIKNEKLTEVEKSLAAEKKNIAISGWSWSGDGKLAPEYKLGRFALC